MADFQKRIIAVTVIIGLLFLIIAARMFQIQVIEGRLYSQKSQSQSVGRRIMPAPRGQILDRNGNCLARSIGDGIEINAKMFNPSGDSLSPKKGNANTKRVYPLGTVAGSIVGWTGSDGGGLGGVEFAYDRYLRGQDGWEIVNRDGKNRKYARLGLPTEIPVSGKDVSLTIDLEIQKIAEKVLSETVRKFGAKAGTCVVADPYTGAILAMANFPDFNPNLWRSFDPERRGNHCIDRMYEPGSTFKVITAAAALQEKVINENDSINGDNGIFEIYGQTIRDHEPYGRISFSQALSYSSNVCFAKVANMLGNKSFYRYVLDFGMGSATGLALPGEASGIVHPVDKWSGRTLVTMAIGQEISATLMQMVMAFSSIANGGILVAPVIVSKISGGQEIDRSLFEPHAKRHVISAETAARLRTMMSGVVDYGTAKSISLSGMSIAGKTGTSQKIDPETGGYSRSKVWSSFIGFVPAQNPMLVCGVMIDEPSVGEYGGNVAAPAFEQVVRQIVSHPELEFAEKLIAVRASDTVVNSDVKKVRVSVPELCGKSIGEAVSLIKNSQMSYEVIGKGAVIDQQTPSAGSSVQKGAHIIMYAGTRKITENGRVMPECTGRSLRDAVNILSAKGMTPIVRGSGSVSYQLPVSGSAIGKFEPCTLFCKNRD